ncbi:DUF1993 domain-containing protein [Roseateles violae]|uniref:DUF1993 domain-containing protein n=1 Tax=Roseateles violae TaxID=3058042 RepID=A0ABT8DWL8_9BURK|nr:DUF1993 domain-containing protein [Pelomonas sp. PFR6]MDN3920729.1 DUF1993 domain-containing protein [Pelomonas sp. PFR6]
MSSPSCPLYESSVPVFLRYLPRLAGLVDKAAEAAAGDAAVLLAARLAPDMLPFESQVQIAAHFALRACFPLAGQPVPDFGEFPSGFDGLRDRIARAIALLQDLAPAQFEAGPDRLLRERAGQAELALPAVEFLHHYALPNFFFHLSCAYAILRARGLALGKQDFDGFHRYG